MYSLLDTSASGRKEGDFRNADRRSKKKAGNDMFLVYYSLATFSKIVHLLVGIVVVRMVQLSVYVTETVRVG